MFLTCAGLDVFEPVLVLLWRFSELVQGAKLAEDSFKTVLKRLNFFGNSVFLLFQPLNEVLSRC